jgi:hypothetical protein
MKGISLAVKEGGTNQHILLHEIEDFVRVLAYLSIYGITPTQYFQTKHSALYPLAAAFSKVKTILIYIKIFQFINLKKRTRSIR